MRAPAALFAAIFLAGCMLPPGEEAARVAALPAAVCPPGGNFKVSASVRGEQTNRAASVRYRTDAACISPRGAWAARGRSRGAVVISPRGGTLRSANRVEQRGMWCLGVFCSVGTQGTSWGYRLKAP